MKSIVTNAAEITVLTPIDNNYKTGGGDVTIGACCLVASKGKPFKAHAIYGSTTTRDDILGNCLPASAYGMEGLRHLEDAIKECSYVNAVRVVNTLSYRYPSLSFLIINDLEAAWVQDQEYHVGDIVTHDGEKWICAYDNSGESTNIPGAFEADWLPYEGICSTDAHKYNESVLVGDGAFMSIYPIDGDTSKNRYMNIAAINETKKRFTLAFYDTDSMGDAYLLESFEVGIDEDNTDDMGLPAYIEKVFERVSSYFRCDFMEGTPWEDILPALNEMLDKTTAPRQYTFVGGTDGGEPTTEDWFIGAELLRNESIACNLLFAAGVDIPDVIMRLAEIADERHCSYFFDVPCYLRYTEAIEWIGSLGLKSRHSRAYHAPFTSNDPWRGGKTVWGVSGTMAAAKALGCKNFTKDIPGVHYSPAGQKRGYMQRTGVECLYPEDILDRDNFYDARINPVVVLSAGGACADDDLTQHFETNYLRFGWINDILDYIDHRFVEAATMAKHEPDGLTKIILYDLVKAIMDDLVLSGALVAPRDSDADGTSPYYITVEQQEIDLWYVQWDVCPTGAARRIVGQPRLIK